MVNRYDVVIVGAGLAGLHCARRMGEAGLSVLLADQKPAVDRSVHTTGIFVRRTLEDFDFPEDCLGPPVRRVVLYSPRGRALPLTSPRDEFRVGRMPVLYRRWLDACLETGVEWRPNARFLGLEADGDGSRVVFDGGAVRAKLVVGADGASSRVGRALGLSENREWIVGVEDVFRSTRSMDSIEGEEPTFHCWLDPVLAPGYIAWVVSDGEETHLGVAGYAARFRPADALRAFREKVDARFGLAGRAPDERRGGRIPVGGVLPRIACARGLLAGDAAGAVSPLTAGGLDPCLRLSELAARVAADFIATGDAAALDAYSGARFRTRFRSRIALRKAISGIRWPWMAEAACAALRTPPLRALAQHVFYGRGSFPDVDANNRDRPSIGDAVPSPSPSTHSTLPTLAPAPAARAVR